MRIRSSFVGAVLAALFIIAVPGTTWADGKPEHTRIQELNAQWIGAIKAKDVRACTDFYADDGRIMPQNAPAAQGAEAIARVWKSLFELKEFSLTFEPIRISVAQAGDVAYDIGTYLMAFNSEQGPVRDRGKYVVVWRKVRGDWKVAADIFNSDGPPPVE
jgi:uncharacterized protein (TIGR02246 family)